MAPGIYWGVAVVSHGVLKQVVKMEDGLHRGDLAEGFKASCASGSCARLKPRQRRQQNLNVSGLPIAAVTPHLVPH